MGKADKLRKTDTPKFDESRDSVILSGTLDDVSVLFAKLVKVHYPNKSEVDIEAETVIMRGEVKNTRGFSAGYQWTPGLLRVKVFKDNGEYGLRNKFVLLYFPNSPPDDIERQQSIARIKDNMRSLGHQI